MAYFWNPRYQGREKITQTLGYGGLEADELAPDVFPKASGLRKYKPTLRTFYDRNDAIDGIVDEYVPPLPPELIAERRKPKSVPFEQRLWVKDAEANRVVCPCCVSINQVNSIKRAQHPSSVAGINDTVTHVYKGHVTSPRCNQDNDPCSPYFPYLHDTLHHKALRGQAITPTITVAEKPILKPAHVYRSSLLGAEDPVMLEAMERFQRAENRLHDFCRRPTSPQQTSRISFPSEKLSVRFSTVPMRYIYTPPIYTPPRTPSYY